MSNERINVLAVMDSAVRSLATQMCGEGVLSGELDEARAAVAELLSAADDMTAPYLETIERTRAMPRVVAAVKAAKGEA